MPPQVGIGTGIGASEGRISVFNPSQVPGLIARLNYQKNVVKDGSNNIISVGDQSASGLSFVPAQTQPVFDPSNAQFGGKPVAHHFDAMSGLASNPSVGGVDADGTVTYGPFTVFLVARILAGAAYLFTRNDGVEYFYGTNNFSSYINRPGGDGTFAAHNLGSDWSVSDAPRTFTLSFDGTLAGTLLYLNGILTPWDSAAGGDPGTSTYTDRLAIMGNLGAGAGSMGWSAELLVYDRVLDAPVREQIEAYLQTEYAHY